MIARIFFLLILLILIPDLYLYKHYVIRKKLSLGKRFLWWLPSLILIVFTIGLSTVKAFAFRSDCHSQSRLFHLFRVRAWLLPHDSLSQELWKSHRFLPGSFHHLYGILQFLDWSSPLYGPSGRVRFERTASVIRWLSHCPVHGCPCGKSPCGLAEESC